jgi:hypothetical protein
MSVLFALRSSAQGRLLVAGASLLCAFAAVLLVGSGSASAALLGSRLSPRAHISARASASRRACNRLKHRNAPRARGRSCNANRSGWRRSKQQVSSSTGAGATHVGTGSAGVVAVQEQPTVNPPELGPIPGAPFELPTLNESPLPIETSPTPPVETPPVETPPVETPPVETPPVETPPVETPPVETPPVETPPVETPPVETPPVETPRVEKTSTTTSLSSSANPSVLGQAVTYRASVHPTKATGTVVFKDAGISIAGCTTQTVSSGTATCAVAGYATTGLNTITAVYNGNTNYLTSTSAALDQTVETRPPFRFFSSTSFWNEPVPANAPVDPNSAAIVKEFDAEIAAAGVAKKGQPYINTTSWSVPIYTVPRTQATVKVTQLASYGSKVNSALQAAWDAVPLPPGAKPAAGTDRDLVVWQPSTDSLWEFWGLEKTGEGWQAKWGGAMDSASTDPGVYGPEAWPGAQTGWGVSATSLSVAGGLITLEDLELGQINHALAVAIPNARSGEYSAPAQRTDGYSTEPLSLPEGAHLRLNPNLNLASLHLPHLTLMLAEAAQRYGIIVRDSAVNVAFCAQDPTPTGTNPYTGAQGYFEGKTPTQLLASFPWAYLEVLKMELH